MKAPVTVPAGGDEDRYLRALSLVGAIPWAQWTIRPFNPSDSILAGTGVWTTTRGRGSNLAWSPIPPTTTLTANPEFPYGFNDGPVWAGRGITGVVSGGVAAKYHGFSFQLDPVAFLSQNGSFGLGPNGFSGRLAFADWRLPQQIDLPQRFGDKSYGRIDLGESHMEWDGRWISAGVATESAMWGPAIEHPLILGNNAGGIPRAFLSTPGPLQLGPVRIEGTIFWGRIEQSSFAIDTGSMNRHFATAAVGSGSLQWVPGLEIGAARFFHVPWPNDGLRGLPWLRVFEGLLKSSLATASNPSGDSPDNQLGSVFFRWAPPTTGFEVYGEYGREDHNGDLRDFLKEPDHDAAYTIGFERAWQNDAKDHLTVVRAEVVNSRLSHLQQASNQVPWYIHYFIHAGHTMRGQVLASPAAFGGGGNVFAVDRYLRGTRWTFRWDRMMQFEFRSPTQLPEPERADVMNGITVENERPFANGRLTVSGTVLRELNRYFDHDAYGSSLTISFSPGLRPRPKS